MRRRRGRRRNSRWILLSLFLVVAVAAGLVFFRPFARSQEDTGSDNLTPLPGKRMTFLVMGVDKREEDVGRSDTMIVVSYSPEDQRLAFLSLPRDTLVQIPGYGFDKLNHSYAYGGEKLTVETVEQLLGISIDHWISLSFQGFERVIDALGGIEIDAEKRMYYVDPYDTGMGPEGLVIDIQPGLQTMDGETALKYARFRMDEEGDLGRIRRQQQVIKAVIKKASQPSVITQLPGLVTALKDAVDTDMSLSEMLKLAKNAKQILASTVETGILNGTAQEIGGVSYQVTDLVEARTMAYQLLVGDDPPASFLAKAREDQLAYEQTLSSLIAAAPESEWESEQSGDEQVSDGSEDESGRNGAGSDNGKVNPGEGSGSEEGPSGDDGGAGGGSHPAPRTIYLLDASGQDLADLYIGLLDSAGYQVVGVATAEEVSPTSMALDYGGQADGLRQVIPGLDIVPQQDPDNPTGITLILGADLAQ